MLYDTSVWIEFLSGSNNQQPLLLKKNIESGIVYICPTIFQEVLQGIRRDEEFDYVRDRLLNLNFMTLDSYFVAEQTAALFRTLRKKGITVKPNDCVIAFFAIHFKVKLVHNDKDFDRLAKHTPLKVYST